MNLQKGGENYGGIKGKFFSWGKIKGKKGTGTLNGGPVKYGFTVLGL